MKITEIYQDIIVNCDILLPILTSKGEFEGNDTATGRMIYQCKWLKESVLNNSLILPAEYIYTLKYVNAERLLTYLASEPQNYIKEIGIYMTRLLHLCQGELIYKEKFQSVTILYIDELVHILNTSSRPLDAYEKNLTQELESIKLGLINGSVIPPLIMVLPNYPNFCQVCLYDPSVSDLPNGKLLIKTIKDIIFIGIRPDNWLTPEIAEHDTLKLFGKYS